MSESKNRSLIRHPGSSLEKAEPGAERILAVVVADALALVPSEDADALYQKGRAYHYGDGVRQDYAEAVRWYRKAAEEGHATAQCALGNRYSFGEGVPQDYAQAVHWYRKAAEQGQANAQYNLAFYYEKGRGVPQDYEQAAHWYRKAAGQGITAAQERLGACYANGRAAIDIEDAVEVYKWVKLAEEHGYEGAAKTAAVIEVLLSPEEFREAERRYRELCSSKRLD